MSWAAGRKGTIVEDRAYSLFGLFRINLPMLYGERDKAFLRLQEEIIKTSDDHSMFSWIDMGDRYGGPAGKNPGGLRRVWQCEDWTSSNTAYTPPAKVATAGSNEWQYAPEEVNGSKNLDARTADDELGWSPISWQPEKGWVASQCPHRQGLWALKGDRVEGLDVFLKLDDALVPITKVKFQKVEMYHGLVWDLQIDNFPG
ncbi:HET domain-containing protein [Apiospora saccharicola]